MDSSRKGPPEADQRPSKRRALSPSSRQAASLDALFQNPSKALSSSEPKPGISKLPPEIVTNVQGSSAGAGSGEFFVYKAARRREYDRLAAMDAESAQEKADAEWERAKAESEMKDKARGRKNKARRDKLKMKRAEAGGEKKPSTRPNDVPVTIDNAEGDRKPEARVVDTEGITIHEDD